MTEEGFQLRCLHCESTRIRAVDSVIQTTEIESWTLGPKGRPRPARYGHQEIWNDDAEPIGTGYECADCQMPFSPDEACPPMKETT